VEGKKGRGEKKSGTGKLPPFSLVLPGRGRSNGSDLFAQGTEAERSVGGQGRKSLDNTPPCELQQSSYAEDGRDVGGHGFTRTK
jgi:hypothetical protein